MRTLNPPNRRSTRCRSILVSMVAIGLVLVGCGGEDSDDETAVTFTESDPVDETGKDAVVVQARDNVFLSESITISAGTEVTFENRGRNEHNVIPVEEGAFTEIEVDAFQPGQDATVTFDEAGTYAYYCTLHGTESSGMIGTVVVED